MFRLPHLKYCYEYRRQFWRNLRTFMFAAPLSWMNPGSLRPLIVSTTSKHYRQLSFTCLFYTA